MSQKLTVTSLSSRGQVVIPLDVRERLHLEEGEMFVVLGEKDTIVLKRIKMPPVEELNKLMKKG